MIKVAFLDRDGVINKNARPHDYIKSVSEFIFNPGIFKILEILKARGMEFIVLTNQRGIARGLLTEKDLADIHEAMQVEFSQKGIKILDIFHCPHEEGACDCRKPGPGLINQALAKYDIDLGASLFIGDNSADKELAEKFNLRFFFVSQDHPEEFLQQYAE